MIRNVLLSAVSIASIASNAPVVSAETLVPYQQQAVINTPNCAGNQCKVTFAAVPVGKRLVLTSVSAQLGPLPGPITLEGGGVTYFVQKAFPEASYVTAPVTLYYAPGTVPTARVFVPPGTGATSLSVTLVGHLVPA